MVGKIEGQSLKGKLALLALRTKAGMSFSFMEITLATPRSIKDSRPRRVDWRRVGLPFWLLG